MFIGVTPKWVLSQYLIIKIKLRVYVKKHLILVVQWLFLKLRVLKKKLWLKIKGRTWKKQNKTQENKTKQNKTQHVKNLILKQFRRVARTQTYIIIKNKTQQIWQRQNKNTNTYKKPLCNREQRDKKKQKLTENWGLDLNTLIFTPFPSGPTEIRSSLHETEPPSDWGFISPCLLHLLRFWFSPLDNQLPPAPALGLNNLQIKFSLNLKMNDIQQNYRCCTMGLMVSSLLWSQVPSLASAHWTRTTWAGQEKQDKIQCMNSETNL